MKVRRNTRIGACLSIAIAGLFLITSFVPFNAVADNIYIRYGSINEYASNPVVGVPAGEASVKDPSVIYSSGMYYMAYSVCRTNGSAYIGMSNSTDFHSWTYMGMVIGNNYSWDSNNSGAPFLFQDGSTYYIYWQGKNTTGNWSIGVASTSTINNASSWTQYAGNPILVGNWGETYYAYDASVLKVGSTYYLYYICGGYGVPARGTSLATSPDKFNWTRYGRVISPSSSYVSGIEATNILQLQSNLYVAYFTDWNASMLQITGDSYSTDMLTWTDVNKYNTPFLTGLHAWDANGASSPSMIIDPTNAGQLLLAYQGDSGGDAWTIGVASVNFDVRPLAFIDAQSRALVNLVFMIFAVGIVVGVVAEGTSSLRKMQMRTAEQMMKSLLNMVIYIVIGMASLGIIYSMV